MSYTITVPVQLYNDQVGYQPYLTVRLYTPAYDPVASATVPGVGWQAVPDETAQYTWTGSIPSGFVGWLRVYDSRDPATILASAYFDGTEEHELASQGGGPEVTLPVVTESEARSFLNVPAAQSGQLPALLDAATQLFEEKTGRLVMRRTAKVFEVELNDATDRFAWVPLTPLDVVTVEEYSDDEAAYSVVPTTDYRFSSDRGRVTLTRAGTTGSPPQWAGTLLRITATGGYSSRTCPLPIKRTVIAQAGLMSRRLSPELIALRSQGFQGGSTGYLDPDTHPFFDAVVRDFERHV